MKNKIKMKILFLPLISLMGFTGNMALADPIISVDYTYYNVKAATASQIPDALAKATPIVRDGKRYRGYTKNNYKWKIETIKSPDNCSVSNVQVTLKTTYTLPKMINLNGHSSKFIQIWNGYFYSLYLHEKGHGEIAKKTSIQLEETLTKIIAKNCSLLKEEITFMGNRTIAKSQIKHDLYDEETKHGQTQGADLRLHMKEDKLPLN
jgi:predicted secreted Zn-dependent protease